MDAETLAEVNKAAARLDDEFTNDPTVSRATFAEFIARRVATGDGILEAVIGVTETVRRMEGVRQSLADINPYEQWEATVEVTVSTVWKPNHGSQRQVGMVTDDSGKQGKFVIWQASGDKRLLHEGDEVRLERAKVSAYKGDVTLAVAGDTDIHLLSRQPAEERPTGDLPPRLGFDDTGDYEEPVFSADSDPHAWIDKKSPAQMEEAIETTLRQMGRDE
jgi:hypothetical protein